MADANGNRRAPRVYIYTYVDKQLVTMNERVKRVEFEDNLKKVDRATIELDNNDLAIFDDDRWAAGAHIYVSYGFYGQMSIPAHMRIKRVGGGRSATIEAVNAAAFGLDLHKRSRTWEHKTYSEVVRDVARDNGLLSPSVQDVEEVHETVTQSNQTDGVFLRELADREGFDFRVVGSSLHWGERDLSPAPVREFSYYSTPESPANIIDFGIDCDVTRRHGRVKSSKRDPLNRQTVNETADNQQDKDRTVLASWALTPGDEDGKFTLSGTAEEPTKEAVTQTVLVNGHRKSAKGAFRAQQRGTVKLWVSTEGQPDLHAGDVVKTIGLGKRLSGKYLVKSVRHNIEARGRYMMTLNLTSDGVNTPRKGSGRKLPLAEAIAQLQRCWARFMAGYRGALEVYLVGFESLVRQLDVEIAGLSVSSYTNAVGAGIVERLGVLRDYLFGFSDRASESSETEQAVAALVGRASECYAASGELSTAILENGFEEQTGQKNDGVVQETPPQALIFDNESGRGSLINDPSVALNKEATSGGIKVKSGTVGAKPMPPNMLAGLAQAAEDAGIE